MSASSQISLKAFPLLSGPPSAALLYWCFASTFSVQFPPNHSRTDNFFLLADILQTDVWFGNSTTVYDNVSDNFPRCWTILNYISKHFRAKRLWTPLLRQIWLHASRMNHSLALLYTKQYSWWSLWVECSLIPKVTSLINALLTKVSSCCPKCALSTFVGDLYHVIIFSVWFANNRHAHIELLGLLAQKIMCITMVEIYVNKPNLLFALGSFLEAVIFRFLRRDAYH